MGGDASTVRGPTVEELRRAGHLKWSSALDAPVLGADAAETDFGTAPAVASALHAAVDRGLLGYVSPRIELELREACAAWWGQRHEWRVGADDVRVVPDVIRALHLAIEHFSSPGAPVIVPVPAYSPFLAVPGLLGRRVIEVPMAVTDGRYEYDLDALEEAFRRGANLLILCNPHNPIGRVLTRDELAAISEVVARHAGRVFADEVHAPLVHDGRRHVPYASVSTEAAQHTLTAVSASKAWNLAGLKCAQVVLSNPADARRWSDLDRLATDGTSVLGLVGSTAAYRDSDAWLSSLLGRLATLRQELACQLQQHLPGVRYAPPEGTYLAWLDCTALDLGGADAAQHFLERAGVSLVAGSTCGAGGEGHVRLNFATSSAVLKEIVRAMALSVPVAARGNDNGGTT